MTWRSMPKHWIGEYRIIDDIERSNFFHLSAIMKYHSIKMAEVNDTMRHLWNRTYQGTGMVPHSDFDLISCLDRRY
jgi:hypothetical protein